MSTSRLYCRLCAEEKLYAEITELATLSSLIEKLLLFGIDFVDFSNKMLPETVCITCYAHIMVFHEFFLKVKKSQVILSELSGVVETESLDTFSSFEAFKKESADEEEFFQDDNISSLEEAESTMKKEKYASEEIYVLTKGPEKSRNPSPKTENPENETNNIDIQDWGEYPAICQYCNIRATNREVLTEHCIRVHRKCFGSRCVDCDVDIDCFKGFVEHVVKHRPLLRNICPYCNIDISDDMNHIEDHTCKRHPCLVCGQIFHRKKRLRKHESTIDPSPLIIPPKRRRKGTPSDKNTTCRICGVIRKTPSSLWSHLQTHTDRKRNHTCDRCGKAFFNKGTLVAHHKIHENNVKEACKICQKSFLTVARLKKHVKTHNLEMPYQCEHCKRLYSSKDRLREHIKVHMNLMPFQCQYCSKKFRHKSIMKTHENQHTGARPYSCDVCCMDFANWSNCNKHMKRKHGTTLAKTVMTPHGKLALNPQTGKPEQLYMDNGVKEWSEKMLGNEKRKKIASEDRFVDCSES